MPFPLPNGERTFLDLNGNPLSGGSVYTYVPGTTDPSPTWTDEGMTVPNPNPVVLDQAGRAVIWGDGLYRQIVYDMFGNLIWDQETGIVIDNLPGNVTIGGNLTVDGNTQLNGSANVSGPLSAQDGLGVNGGATINGGANVSGGLNTDGINDSGDLNVGGTSNLNGNANVGGTLTVTGPSDLNGGLTTSSIADTGNLAVGGDLGVSGNAQIDGNLNVNGTITSGGGTPTPTPTPTIIPVRVANVGNGSTDNVSTSDGLVSYQFDPTQYNVNFTIQLPSGAPTGFTVTLKLGLMVYASQTPIGSSTDLTASILPASGGNIDGMTFSPPVSGGVTLPLQYSGVGLGFSYVLTNGGGDTWYVTNIGD